jgi:hypothetical protein
LEQRGFLVVGVFIVVVVVLIWVDVVVVVPTCKEEYTTD